MLETEESSKYIETFNTRGIRTKGFYGRRVLKKSGRTRDIIATGVCNLGRSLQADGPGNGAERIGGGARVTEESYATSSRNPSLAKFKAERRFHEWYSSSREVVFCFNRYA